MNLPGRRLAAPLLFLAFPVFLRLAYPPFSLGFFAPAAFGLLFQGLAVARRPVAWAFSAHLLFVVLLCPWLFTALTGHYHLSVPLALVLFLGVACAPPSVFFAAFALAIKKRTRAVAGAAFPAGLSFALFAASAFVVTEWLRSLLSLEKGWGHLATAFFGHPAFLGWASLWGRAGLSFLLVFWGALSWLMVRAARERRQAAGAFFLTLALTVGAVGCLGALRHGKTPPPAILLETALVHPAIRQEDRWQASSPAANLARYRALSLSAFPGPVAPGRTRLVVWPETAITRALVSFPEAREAVAKIAREKDAFVLLGSPHFMGSGEDRRFYNSVFLAGTDGEILDRYDKILLLPLAEAATGPLSIQTENYHGNYHPGEEDRVLVLPTAQGPLGLGVAVCFEVASAPHLAKCVRAGATVLANLSNDAWFGRGSESEQQLSLLALACAEHGVAGIRSTGYGVSALVDPRGRVLAKTGILEPPLLSGPLPVPARSPTPETRFPSWFVLLAGLILALSVLPRAQAKIDNKPSFT